MSRHVVVVIAPPSRMAFFNYWSISLRLVVSLLLLVVTSIVHNVSAADPFMTTTLLQAEENNNNNNARYQRDKEEEEEEEHEEIPLLLKEKNKEHHFLGHSEDKKNPDVQQLQQQQQQQQQPSQEEHKDNQHEEKKESQADIHHVQDKTAVVVSGAAAAAVTETSLSLSASYSITPVIGILAQPIEIPIPGIENGTMYIAASYIKWLESAGARTIAIPYTANETLLDELFDQIHMVFLPGGNSPYPKAMLNYLLDKVTDYNNRLGKYFPVWGTCLGFEFLVEYTAQNRSSNSPDGDKSVVEWGFAATNISWPLEHVIVQELYHNPFVYDAVRHSNVTFNSHTRGITPSTLKNHVKLNQTFEITSINHDQNGKAFVSTIEPKNHGGCFPLSSSTTSMSTSTNKNQQSCTGTTTTTTIPPSLPFYGVQYHPEKNGYENAMYPDMPTVPYLAINHSPLGVAFSFHMAQFVISLARQSQEANPTHVYTKTQMFPPIYIYPIHVTTMFEQIYLVPSSTTTTIDTTTTKTTKTTTTTSTSTTATTAS